MFGCLCPEQNKKKKHYFEISEFCYAIRVTSLTPRIEENITTKSGTIFTGQHYRIVTIQATGENVDHCAFSLKVICGRLSNQRPSIF